MSSSECQHPIFVDLQVEEPAPPRQDFAEQSEFERVEQAVSQPVDPEESYRNGLAEGEQRGRAAALKELEPVIEELKSLSLSMAVVRKQRLADAESEIVQVATEATRRVLRGELSQTEDVVLALAKACIQEAQDESSLVLRVNPADLEHVRAHLPEFELDLAEQTIEVQADPGVSQGGVVLDTPRRCYDGRPERILLAAEQQIETGEDS